MRISIIIPVHNAEDTLSRCVDSIIEQNYHETEIILVENHSTDSSYSLCKSLSQKYKNIICRQTDLYGVSSARNAGLDIATGEIIGFCDADDFQEKNALKIVSQQFQDENLEILVTGFYRRNLEKDEKQIFSLNKDRYVSEKELMGRLMNDTRIMGSVWNKFYRASVIGDIRFRESLSYCEDTHFNMLVLTQNKICKCKIIQDALYNYVYNPVSVTNDINNFFDENEKLKYINSFYSILEDCELDRSIVRQVGTAMVRLGVGTLRCYSISGKRREFLIDEIRKHFLDFLLGMWKYSTKHNIKTLLLCVIELCVE